MTDKILHKISKVQDSVCEKCPQLWERICRAYSVPHSAAERAARESAYGIECDSDRMKRMRNGAKTLLYHIPPAEVPNPTDI